MGTLSLPLEDRGGVENRTLANKRMALLLGAGFSKWAVGLPVANELFDFNVALWGVRDERRLSVVASLKEEWDGQHADGAAEEFVDYALHLSPRQREALLWYLGRRLSEPFVWHSLLLRRERRYVLTIDDKRKLEVPGLVAARRFLQGLCTSPMSGIVTTNYDMVVECALGAKAFNYGVVGQKLLGSGPYPLSQWKYPMVLRGRVPLAKIHGSVSWDDRGYYLDGRRALTGRARIVAPTPEKQRPRELAHVWELAERVLTEAQRLLVFGFAFNPYDEAVLGLLRSARPNLRSVLLVDVHPRAGRAKELWPDAEVVSAQPPPEGSKRISAWCSGRS